MEHFAALTARQKEILRSTRPAWDRYRIPGHRSLLTKRIADLCEHLKIAQARPSFAARTAIWHSGPAARLIETISQIDGRYRSLIERRRCVADPRRRCALARGRDHGLVRRGDLGIRASVAELKDVKLAGARPATAGH